MSLSPQRASAGRRARRRCAAALIVVLLVFGPLSRYAIAQDADAFAATVTVDATAETAAKARDLARLDGQRRAAAALATRLAGSDAAVKLPKLDDKSLTDLVASFEVANERMSAVRYVADYTFHFRPAEMRRVLQRAGIAVGGEPSKSSGEPAKPTTEAGKPLIVVPVYQAGTQARLWEDPNPWRDAWDQRSPGEAPALRLILPLGDAADVAAVDADRAAAGNADALSALAKRNGSEEALVALAATSGPPDKPTGLDVTVKRYRGGQLVDTHLKPIEAKAGESDADLLRRAVAETAAAIESGWKEEPVPGYDQRGSLTAVLPITGLDDWVQARERLAAVPAIRNIGLIALSRQEATIEIGYQGNIDQLKTALAGISLELVRGDPLWRLARSTIRSP